MIVSDKEVSSFIAEHEDYINAYIKGKISKDYLLIAIHGDESNYNNADISSGMTVYDYSSLSRLLHLSVERLKANDDRCSHCAKLIDNNEYLYKKATSPNVEEVHHCVGYRCNKCHNIGFYE